MTHDVCRALAGTLLLLGCTGPAGEPGPAGDDLPGSDGDEGDAGEQASPSISAITPHRVFLARTVDVTISGYGVDWSDEATVVFDTVNGPEQSDIEVLEVKRASPTALVATIRTDAETVTGVRSVEVVDGDERLLQPGSFTVLPSVVVPTASLLQGALAILPIQQRDPLAPLHPRHNDAWLDGATKWGWVNPVHPYRGNAIIGVDVFSEPGHDTLLIQSSPDTISVAPNAVEVVERLPQVLTGDTLSLEAISFASDLFALDLSANQIANVEVSLSSGTEDDVYYLLLVLPPSGEFGGLLGYKRYVPNALPVVHQIFAPADGRYFLTVEALGWVEGYGVDMTIDKQPASPVPLSPPVTIEAGPIVGLEADIYTIEAEAGQRIDARIGDGATDTCGPSGFINSEIQLLTEDGAELAHGVGTTGLCQGLSADVPQTGTYYLKVSAATFAEGDLVSGQWPCVPVDEVLCGFDYSLTVEVQ